MLEHGQDRFGTGILADHTMHNAMLHVYTLGRGTGRRSIAVTRPSLGCHQHVTPLSPVLSPYCHPTVNLLSPYCHPDADTPLPHLGMKGEKAFLAVNWAASTR